MYFQTLFFSRRIFHLLNNQKRACKPIIKTGISDWVTNGLTHKNNNYIAKNYIFKWRSTGRSFGFFTENLAFCRFLKIRAQSMYWSHTVCFGAANRSITTLPCPSPGFESTYNGLPQHFSSLSNVCRYTWVEKDSVKMLVTFLSTKTTPWYTLVECSTWSTDFPIKIMTCIRQ